MKKYPIKIPNVKNAAGTLSVYAPFDGTELAVLDTVDEVGAKQAIANATEVFNDKSQHLPAWERIKVLENVIALMHQKYDEILLTSIQEGGKPYADTKIELERAIDGVKSCIECIRSSQGEEIPMGINLASANRLAFTSYQPIGPVLAFSAFNHPINLIIHQVMPAVACGCPVIIKPASNTPLSAFLLAEILQDAGLPNKWCQPLVVADHTVSDVLIKDARIAFFSFIGGSKIGWKLRSKLAAGTRCALEHGGAAPVIVAEDADIKTLIPLIAKGGMYHAGQVCVSVQRVFVHESIIDQVVDKLKVEVSNMKVGNPEDKDTAVGPFINRRELQRVDEWVQEALTEGAELIYGGKKISTSLYEPTLLLNPANDSKVSTQEIFGPVICLYSYNNIDQAINLANALPYSFQAAIFTSNIDKAMQAYQSLNASAVMINDHSAFRVDWMPFAGLHQSGYGIGGIPHTYQDMQIKKMIVIKSANIR